MGRTCSIAQGKGFPIRKGLFVALVYFLWPLPEQTDPWVCQGVAIVMSIKILATGDLHIGNQSSRIPGIALEGSLNQEDFSCGKMWERLVECATEQKVDLVLLSGDIVHKNTGYLAAIGRLERGLTKLYDAGIQTYATGGNHDYRVFQELAQSLETISGFHTIRKKGEWEYLEYEKEGELLARIHGWCFPDQHHTENPLMGYSPPQDEDAVVPTIGLLHANLDYPPGDKYAPVPLTDLQSKENVAIWVLGHQHAPTPKEALAGRPIVFYPGSPQAMKPGENGDHGPWIIEIDDSSTVSSCQQLPLSSVRYDEWPIDITDCENEDLKITIQNEATRYAETTLSDLKHPPHLALLRLVLSGESAAHQGYRNEEFAESIYSEDLSSTGETEIYVEKIIDDSRPVIDLAEVAERKDPMGVIARLIIDLESDNPSSKLAGLIADCQNKLGEIHQRVHYKNICEEIEAGPDEAIRILTQQARRLLLKLQEQGPTQ